MMQTVTAKSHTGPILYPHAEYRCLVQHRTHLETHTVLIAGDTLACEIPDVLRMALWEQCEIPAPRIKTFNPVKEVN